MSTGDRNKKTVAMWQALGLVHPQKLSSAIRLLGYQVSEGDSGSSATSQSSKKGHTEMCDS